MHHTPESLADEIERNLVDNLARALALQEEFEARFDQSYDDWERGRGKRDAQYRLDR